MEDILQEIGLSYVASRLRAQNFTLQYFIRHLSSPINAQQFREHIMVSCGIADCDVVAICDRVQEFISARERAERFATKPSSSNSSLAKGGSKRLSMLLAKPVAQQKSPIMPQKGGNQSPLYSGKYPPQSPLSNKQSTAVSNNRMVSYSPLRA